MRGGQYGVCSAVVRGYRNSTNLKNRDSGGGLWQILETKYIYVDVYQELKLYLN